ncbi:MAG: hypothetical protein ACLVHY_03665 [Gemmiger sp.]
MVTNSGLVLAVIQQAKIGSGSAIVPRTIIIKACSAHGDCCAGGDHHPQFRSWRTTGASSVLSYSWRCRTAACAAKGASPSGWFRPSACLQTEDVKNFAGLFVPVLPAPPGVGVAQVLRRLVIGIVFSVFAFESDLIFSRLMDCSMPRTNSAVLGFHHQGPISSSKLFPFSGRAFRFFRLLFHPSAISSGGFARSVGQLLRQFLKGTPLAVLPAQGQLWAQAFARGGRLRSVHAGTTGCFPVRSSPLHGKTGGRRGRRRPRLYRIIWGHDRLAHGFASRRGQAE